MNTNRQTQLKKITIAAGLAKFIVGTFALSLSPLLIEIEMDLHIPKHLLGYAGGSYGLSSGIMALLSSTLQDKYPRTRLIIVGIAIHFIGILLTSFALSFYSLVAGKIICGIGAGLLLPAIVAYLSDRTPYDNRASLLGKTNVGWAASTLIGVPLLSFIGFYFEWRMAQFCLSLIWLLILMLLFQKIDLAPLESNETTAKVGIGSDSNIISMLPMFIVTFLLFSGFYGIYSFLGVSISNSNTLINGLLIGCYGIGFLTATRYSKIIDRFGKEKLFLISLIILTFLFLLISYFATKNQIILGFLLYLLGNTQNIAFTSSTSIVSGSAENIRGKALAINQSALSFGVAFGTSSMGYVLSKFNFMTVGICAASFTFIAIIITKFKILNNNANI